MSSDQASRDTASIDNLVRALYESISFEPDSQPDYKRLRAIFHPEGRLIPPRERPGDPVNVLDLESFIRTSREHIIVTGMEGKGFSEREIHRTVDALGSLMQIFSTYESKLLSPDAPPPQRGVQSIQAVREGERWLVISILWEVESARSPIPAKYL